MDSPLIITARRGSVGLQAPPLTGRRARPALPFHPLPRPPRRPSAQGFGRGREQTGWARKPRTAPGSKGRRSEVQGIRPSVITGSAKWVTERKQGGICILFQSWSQYPAGRGVLAATLNLRQIKEPVSLDCPSLSNLRGGGLGSTRRQGLFFCFPLKAQQSSQFLGGACALARH